MKLADPGALWVPGPQTGLGQWPHAHCCPPSLSQEATPAVLFKLALLPRLTSELRTGLRSPPRSTLPYDLAPSSCLDLELRTNHKEISLKATSLNFIKYQHGWGKLCWAGVCSRPLRTFLGFCLLFYVPHKPNYISSLSPLSSTAPS